MKIERALPVDGQSPSYVTRSNRLSWGAVGRLLLFVYLNEQAADADDDQGVSEELTVCNHGNPPFRGTRVPLLMGANHLPL